MMRSFLCLFLLTVLFGCGPEQRVMELKGVCMGTSYTIKGVVTGDQNDQQLQDDIDALLAQFDVEMSNWNPKSWVVRFNQSTSTDWQDAPNSVIEVVDQSLQLFEKSRGAFDITVSPLIERWGFGARERKGIPDQQELQELLKNIGSQNLELDKVGHRLRKKISNLSINASALAKGYGVDLVTNFLKANHIENIMVEIGGEVSANGHFPDRKGWNIGIRKPDITGNPGLQGVVSLENVCMATSGDYQNFFIENGVSFNHILDPSTGTPVQHQLCSASVVAPQCALADGLATTCLVLGTKLSLEWIKQFPNCSIYLIERQQDGSFKSFQSENFPTQQ